MDLMFEQQGLLSGNDALFLLFMYKLQADRLFSDRYSGLELTIEGHERKLNQRKPKCFQQAQLR